MRLDPVAVGELVEQRAVEAARGSVIDVLDGGLLAQSGVAQSGGCAAVIIADASAIVAVSSALAKGILSPHRVTL